MQNRDITTNIDSGYFTVSHFMNLPRVPPLFIGGMAEMPELLASIARMRGMDEKHTERVCELVPETLRSAPCFLDRLTHLWRYDFGNPFTRLPDGGAVFGTQMYQEVENLLRVLDAAERILPKPSLDAYLSRLADESKHEDALVEFAPIVRMEGQIDADFEASGYCEGNRTVDWAIRIPGRPMLLLDVKNRVRDLFEFFAALDTSGLTAPAPRHDPALLFKSLESKFRQSDKANAIQVGWIKTGIKQERGALLSAFAKLDSSRVHYAVLGDWKDDVFVLGPDDEDKKWVLEVLRARESNRFVFLAEDG